MNNRGTRPRPRTFEHFPEEATCPVCGTSDDGECVLIAIDGTEEGSVVEAQPTHLSCAVADRYSKGAGIIYRRVYGGQGGNSNRA
jgi:hypothetical protein